MLHGLRGRGVRGGGLRAYTAAMGVMVALGLVAGCGNRDEVCDETAKAFQDLATRVGTAPAADSARWKQAVEQFAGRLDALAAKSDDKKLSKALKDASASARQAAAAVGSGDAAPLQRFTTEQPKRVGELCS